jgi:hypothetical protein
MMSEKTTMTTMILQQIFLIPEYNTDPRIIIFQEVQWIAAMQAPHLECTAKVLLN